MSQHWKNYPAAVLRAVPEQVEPALAAHYVLVPADQLAQAQGELARAVALFEETPRGTLGPALRRHLNIIVNERERRGEVTNG